MTGIFIQAQVEERAETPTLWRRLDVTLLLTVLGVSGFGVAMIYSATARALEAGGNDPGFFAQRQITFIMFGFTLMIAAYVVDHEFIKHLSGQLYMAGIVALLLVILIGAELNGARSWFQLPGFQLQPSELMKPVVIVTLSAYLSSFQGDVHFGNFFVGLGIGSFPILLILKQPDLGTSLVFIAILMGVFLVGGAKFRHILLATATGITVITLIMSFGLLGDSQQDRIDAFINPEENPELVYNAEQAKIAIGNGGISGQGYRLGQQTRGNFVPFQESDFIFTVVGEEFGFIGAAGLLAAYAFILWRIWRIAMVAKDMFGTVLCFGVLAMMTFQIFQNVGMAVGIMPITGIPLPFMSHGGSSTVALFVSLGLVLNVNARRFAR